MGDGLLLPLRVRPHRADLAGRALGDRRRVVRPARAHRGASGHVRRALCRAPLGGGRRAPVACGAVRVALFITCVNDTLFPEAGRATVEVLERLGHTVRFPEEQTCCGQMHANSGYGDEALPLLARFVRVFGADAYDAIVAPSGSCVAMVRHHYAQLAREAGRATVEVLERLGHTVRFPEEQTCCGQMHANSGYGDEALPLLARFVRVFGADAYDAIVAPSGSCVAMVRHHYAQLAREAGRE